MICIAKKVKRGYEAGKTNYLVSGDTKTIHGRHSTLYIYEDGSILELDDADCLRASSPREVERERKRVRKGFEKWKKQRELASAAEKAVTRAFDRAEKAFQSMSTEERAMYAFKGLQLLKEWEEQCTRKQ